MNKAIETLTHLLKSKIFHHSYLVNDEDILNLGINNWNKTIIGSDNKYGFISFGIDLVIFASFKNKTELGENTLANAGAIFFASEEDGKRPIAGIVNINREVDYTKSKAKQ